MDVSLLSRLGYKLAYSASGREEKKRSERAFCVPIGENVNNRGCSRSCLARPGGSSAAHEPLSTAVLLNQCEIYSRPICICVN